MPASSIRFHGPCHRQFRDTCRHMVLGTHGVIAKLVALPEFVIIVALARVVGAALRARGLPALRVLLVAKVCFLLAFFVLGTTLGPFPDSDVPAALLTGFAGVAGMAVQNAVQRVHFAGVPPTTIMTGNTTQAVLEAVDLMRGVERDNAAAIRVRFGGDQASAETHLCGRRRSIPSSHYHPGIGWPLSSHSIETRGGRLGMNPQSLNLVNQLLTDYRLF